MVHLKQHDDGTRLIHKARASQTNEWVVVKWKRVGEDPLEVVVLRSEKGFAGDLGELFAEGTHQTLVFYDPGDRFQDQQIGPDIDYYYTVFARAADGSWHRQDQVHLKTTGHWEYKRHELEEGANDSIKKMDLLRVGYISGMNSPM
jgi:hypothetical protein